MRILFELHHPKHYYQVKHLFHRFDDHLFVIKNKDILEELLKNEGVKYVRIGSVKSGISKKILHSTKLLISFSLIIQKFQPDVIFSKASPYSSFLSVFFSYKSVISPDSEVVELTNKFISKFADRIITQHCFGLNFGHKHVRLDTFFESCYLHPNYFQADSSILNKYGFKRDDKIILLRFIGWNANHDIGKQGFSKQNKIDLVKQLEKYGKVIISSEEKLPAELESNKFNAPVNVMHQLLHKAVLYMGDSQSMATEAALLGTPAIRCNSFVGSNDMSNFIFLEEKLNMLYNYTNINTAIDKAFEILKDNNSKNNWIIKRTNYFSTINDPVDQLYNYLNNVNC